MFRLGLLDCPRRCRVARPRPQPLEGGRQVTGGVLLGWSWVALPRRLLGRNVKCGVARRDGVPVRSGSRVAGGGGCVLEGGGREAGRGVLG